MAALGDIIYRAASLWQRLAGNSSTTRKFLRQVGNGSASAAPVWDDVNDSDVVFTDITTGNVSTTKHGYAPKAPNDAAKYLDGTGAYSVPAGTGGSAVTVVGTPVANNLTKFAGATSIQAGDLTGDVTTSGAMGTTIANDAVSFAKMQNIATQVAIARNTAGTGDPESVTISQMLDWLT